MNRSKAFASTVAARRSSVGVEADRLYAFAQVLVLALVFVTSLFFFDFTAEDAYITYRYAENFVTTGTLVFNLGEPINALTSPLHALLSAGLFFVTGQTVVGNKLLALLLLLGSAALVWRRLRGQPQWQLLALILVLMPPSVLLWTFGGLETPILLCLATAATCLAGRIERFGPGRLCAVGLLAGLAFLTRYDSILFFGPLLLYAATQARSVRHVAAASLAAAVLPAAWLALSLVYYGDLLPTSFYVKTPNGSLGSLAFNSLYVAGYLLAAGVVPVAALALARLRLARSPFQVWRGHFKRLWWLYLGLALQLLYGLTIATHHMMFSCRWFVPYLPAVAILALDLAAGVSEARSAPPPAGRRAWLLPAFLLGLAAFQLFQTAYTYSHSVNGITLVGEYRSLGLRQYVSFMQTLRQEAYDIEAHWQSLPDHASRPPRIITYAGGMLPYTFRDAYIYEKLVSYRHCYQRQAQALHADYIHLLAPRHGTIEQQLPRPLEHYVLVSAYEMEFDGSPQQFLVYYDPTPEPPNLPARINEPCLSSAPAGQPSPP